MKRKFSPLAIIGMVIGGLALAVLFAFLFGWLVMLLWNRLMPQIFGLPQITYWQGWGLVLLSHILIKGGWGCSGGGKGGRGDRNDRNDHGDRGGKGRDRADEWCDDCATCDYSDSCRPFNRGWTRTADGWIREGGAMDAGAKNGGAKAEGSDRDGESPSGSAHAE